MKQHILLLQGVCEFKATPKEYLAKEEDFNTNSLTSEIEDEDGDKSSLIMIENGQVYLKPNIVYKLSNGKKTIQLFENDDTMNNTVLSIIHVMQQKSIKIN